MKVTGNGIVGRNMGQKVTFSMAVNSNTMKSMIEKALGDPRRAASFTSTLISVVSSNSKLAECRPDSIVAAALRGEGMGLSLALGQYSIVPYGDTANYQMSYKGLAQLASRSNQYTAFDVLDVREGEYKGSNPRTRQPVIEWLDDEERENKPLIGFYGFYELKSGFFKSIYWSHEKILKHADRYSKAFSKEKYDALVSGKLPQPDADKLRSGSPWYDEPLSEAHMKMCKKTVLLQLLGDGVAPLSIEMVTVIDNEKASERFGNEVIYENDPVVVEANQKPVENVDTETGEILSKPLETAETGNPAPRARKAVSEAVKPSAGIS